MLEFAVICGSLIIMRRHLGQIAAPAPAAAPALAPKKVNPHLAQLVSYADRLFAERKWLAAEKAYLNVLKADHKNVTAYLHLGVIYSTQKNMDDAIECFTIAARLRPAGTTFQNLALAFYDNKNYVKSVATYEKAIMLEPNSARYIGLGKAQLKLKDAEAAIKSFEQAVTLDPTKKALQKLADAYDEAGQPANARTTRERLKAVDQA